VKRAIDLFAAFSGLLLLAPVMALIAIAVCLEDFRSPLYRGQRIARGGRAFRMCKFRTMTMGGGHNGVNSTASGDPRITRVGRWLRWSKLDELPQLFHVLTGQMSLVGPRPQVPEEVERYTARERELLHTRPGMTDLASIVFADEGEILEGSSDPDLLYNQIVRPWKSRLALIYADRGNRLGLDLQILALTLVGLVHRGWALRGIQTILEKLGADPLLRRMAARREPLMAHRRANMKERSARRGFRHPAGKPRPGKPGRGKHGWGGRRYTWMKARSGAVLGAAWSW
jgi:lipopolysaccharide/colanic/teichoic acid biosynthesis glycosyltransferase